MLTLWHFVLVLLWINASFGQYQNRPITSSGQESNSSFSDVDLLALYDAIQALGTASGADHFRVSSWL